MRPIDLLTTLTSDPIRTLVLAAAVVMLVVPVLRSMSPVQVRHRRKRDVRS
jgi:hypothetical protein